MFGTAHLAALALALLFALAASAAVRGPRADRALRYFLAALLLGSWLCWYILFAWRGWLTLANGLPLNLCDWASAALVVALLGADRRAYMLGYFWGLGGTLQAALTPDIQYGFPDPQFLFFFLKHGTILAALLYLTLGAGFRPHLRAMPRIIAATLGYALVAGFADWLLGTNYGFLRAKPANISLLALLSPWPWYIPELVLIGVGSMLLYYAPFFAVDLSRARRR